jgi:Family of unknown function (DUF5681)
MATQPNPSRWKKGESGNAAGKPKGTGRLQAMREQLADDVPEILAALSRMAKQGDPQAARLILERVLPPLKPEERPAPIALPDGTLSAQGRAVLSALAAGALAPGQAAQLLSAIGSLARVIEIDELTERITNLEKKQHAKP